MKFIYNIAIRFYYCAILFASFFNKKASLWISGRKNIFERLRLQIKANEEVIWFHCASLGEFEQGRPLVERIKNQEPRTKILLTFFSPSGYEVRKNYSGADYIYYLPLDTVANMRQFMNVINPAKVFFIKYEFWYNCLKELKKRNIPTYLVSGIFRDEHYFFKWYGSWFRKQLQNFTFFFLQNESSQQLLQSIGYENSMVSGDTRFDRVYAIAESRAEIPLIKKFKENKKVLVAGSTWTPDEELLSKLRMENLKLIIVPHEINGQHMQSIMNLFSSTKVIAFSQADESRISSYNVLVIDNIGMLSSLYAYADVAYMGGGFGKGIHNILEAAVYGVPVIFGPQYKKFEEATALTQMQGAYSIDDSQQLKSLVSTFLSDENKRLKAGDICKNYVVEKKGATDKILNYIN